MIFWNKENTQFKWIIIIHILLKEVNKKTILKIHMDTVIVKCLEPIPRKEISDAWNQVMQHNNSVDFLKFVF